MSAPRNKTRNGRVIRGIAAAVTVLPLLALLPQYATAQVNVSVSPRAYLTSITAGDFSEPAVYVTGGLSLTFGPANGSWDITLNALSGSGDSDFTELAEVAFGQAGDWEADRTDYEIMWRYRLEDSPVYVGVGLREVEFIGTFTGDISGEVEVETTETTLGEFLVGFSTQASEGSRHAWFANLVLGYGNFDYRSVEPGFATVEDDGSALIIDANVGYQYTVNPNLSFSSRYRGITFTSYGFEDDQTVVHGPEIALTFRF